MNIDDITRKQPLRHVGYIPANISISRFAIASPRIWAKLNLNKQNTGGNHETDNQFPPISG